MILRILGANGTLVTNGFIYIPLRLVSWASDDVSTRELSAVTDPTSTNLGTYSTEEKDGYLANPLSFQPSITGTGHSSAGGIEIGGLAFTEREITSDGNTVDVWGLTDLDIQKEGYGFGTAGGTLDFPVSTNPEVASTDRTGAKAAFTTAALTTWKGVTISLIQPAATVAGIKYPFADFQELMVAWFNGDRTHPIINYFSFDPYNSPEYIEIQEIF